MKQLISIQVATHLLLLIPGLALAAEGTKIKDTESASHGADDAFHQLVDTYKFPGFEIVQFNLPVLSHYSYLVVSAGEALLVDPDRDINAYLDYAKKNNLAIKGVFLTHSHADFVAGHLEAVRALQVPIYQNAASGAQYKIEPLQDGSTFRVGKATVKAITTPGHTPDGMCGLVSGEGDTAPRAILTGDTLFVGSIGRPDLLEGTMTAATLAAMSFDTWHNKLSKLPDACVVLPAHGAGSLCGAHLSDAPSSTIGGERASNPYLQKKGRSEFIAAVLEGLPEAPQYFKHNAALNRTGPPLVDWDAAPVAAPVAESHHEGRRPMARGLARRQALRRRPRPRLHQHRSARPARNVGRHDGHVASAVGVDRVGRRDQGSGVPPAPGRLRGPGVAV